jgi:hypothetical protein
MNQGFPVIAWMCPFWKGSQPLVNFRLGNGIKPPVPEGG